MNQLHAPKASRNQDTGRLSFMGQVSRAPGRPVPRGAPSRRRPRRVSGPISIFSAAPCTFSSVSALSAALTAAVRRAAPVVAAAALVPALTTAPALAAVHDEKPGEKKQPQPPAAMSTVGGVQLGKPGTQVNLRAGAPVLPKEVTGRSWIVADAESGQVLASHNAHWRLPPASTMKMLFADTLLPKLPKDAEHTVTDEELAGVGEGSSLVGVKEDHSYSVHDLWLGVFLRSGNDAVHVLAAMNDGLDKTVRDMQAHAEELQALDTTVVSPDGYDEPGQVSSAYDLTLIARSGLQKKDFREYCSTVTAQFPGEQKPGKKRESFAIQNTNRLLTGESGVSPYKGIAGVKNGSTTHAGSTFTGVAERNGRVLLVTVMNPDSEESQAVYKEAARLLDWGFAASGKVTPVGELVAPRSAEEPSDVEPVREDADGASGPSDPVAAAQTGSSGMGIALAVAGGVLILLAAAAFLVKRRWPLPDRGEDPPGP
ncbi:D-alanyl-D-alanine carboxypeptidase [Streptomyces sp. C10-9-1]|uniref:D-alanyl-D-alanine carboxypeptidase n=1 Tax=Streptomyces sp. C10-9-1 TaxID=1859285 RepID=UPI003D72E970